MSIISDVNIVLKWIAKIIYHFHYTALCLFLISLLSSDGNSYTSFILLILTAGAFYVKKRPKDKASINMPSPSVNITNENYVIYSKELDNNSSQK